MMTMILFVAVLLAVVVVDVADAFNIIGRHNQLRPAAPHRIRHQHDHTSSGSSSSGPALSASAVSVDEEDVVLESSSLYGFEKSKLLTIISKQKVGSDDDSGGYYYRFQHLSTSTKTKMIFGLFLPSSYNESSAVSYTHLTLPTIAKV